MSLPVRLSPRAARHASDIGAWWRANRPSSPLLFETELVTTLASLADAPGVGAYYGTARGVRRVLLRRSQYHVYYVVGADEVRVLAVWHARRGEGPPLG